ncbi:hypothetical protein [Peribacillus simplex]|uniref:hypothetical protein n=1 Tax=Peribacillus simplex TaxID=1478 RepID=UPI001140B33D|nr:hypothetical protein [Peribacillus simplex]
MFKLLENSGMRRKELVKERLLPLHPIVLPRLLSILLEQQKLNVFNISGLMVQHVCSASSNDN